MKTRRSLHGLFCLLLMLATLIPAPAVFADYDPDAEIQRLIDMAKEEKGKAEAGVLMLTAKRDTLKATFLELNATQKQIADLLYKVRMTDARNKAMMTIKTGLLFKTALDVPRSLTATVTDIFVMVGSDYLQNNHPELFDTRAHQLTATFAADGVKAVEKLNWIISLDDEALSGMIRAETPDLARDKGALSDLITGGKLPDDLIALKRAEYIIKAGTEAENAIKAVKQELINKQSVILSAINRLEQEVKRREEDIRSWERNLDLGRSLRSAPIPQPQPVAYSSGASLDFGTAANQMRDALAQLKANKVDCNGYNMLRHYAEAAAGNRLYELFMQQVWPSCSGEWFSDACQAANRRFDPTIRQSHNTQLGNARQWLAEQFANEKPRVTAFLPRLQRWQGQTITIPYFGHLKTTTFQPGVGADAALAVWSSSEIARPASYLDEYWSDMQLPLGAPPLLEAINKTWAITNAHVRDLDHDLGLAQAAHSQANAAAGDADSLAKEWEPNLYFWNCVGGLGPGLNKGMLRQLKSFKLSYESGAAAGREDANRYLQAAKARHGKLSALTSAYRMETNLLRAGNEASQIRNKLLNLQGQGVGLSSPGLGYALWRTMTSAGVTETMVKELAEVIPKLKNEEFALKYVPELHASQDPKRKPVLGPDALVNLRDNLKTSAAFLVPIYNDYQSLYGQLRHKQTELDQDYRSLRGAVEGVLGEPAEYIVAPLLLDPRYFMDANDFPDPSAGVFEQLDQYEKLAGQYHAIIDPLHPASFHLVKPMEELVKRLERERGGLMGLDESAFSQGVNAFSGAAVELAQKALRAGGRLGPQALLNKSYNKLMALIVEISSTYNQGKKFAEVTRQLNQLIGDVNEFLVQPDRQGGPAAAITWSDAIETVLRPDSEASQLRGDRGVAGLLDQLTTLRDKLKTYQSSGGDAAVRKLYQDFAEAYQAKALGRLTRFLTTDWKAGDGADLTDLEDILVNSFRVFDRIQFAISNLVIKPAGGGQFQASYTVTITGQIHSMNMKHQESASVEDTVVLTPEGPKIKATRGGRLWLQ